MTIAPDLVAQILRLHAVEKWRVGTIARQLHVHRDVVHRVLAGNCAPVHPSPLRPSRIDPYRLFIEQTLVKFPTSTRACSGGDRYKPTMEPSMPAPAENASERRWRER